MNPNAKEFIPSPDDQRDSPKRFQFTAAPPFGNVVLEAEDNPFNFNPAQQDLTVHSFGPGFEGVGVNPNIGFYESNHIEAQRQHLNTSARRFFDHITPNTPDWGSQQQTSNSLDVQLQANLALAQPQLLNSSRPNVPQSPRSPQPDLTEPTRRVTRSATRESSKAPKSEPRTVQNRPTRQLPAIVPKSGTQSTAATTGPPPNAPTAPQSFRGPDPVPRHTRNRLPGQGPSPQYYPHPEIASHIARPPATRLLTAPNSQETSSQGIKRKRGPQGFPQIPDQQGLFKQTTWRQDFRPAIHQQFFHPPVQQQVPRGTPYQREFPMIMMNPAGQTAELQASDEVATPNMQQGQCMTLPQNAMVYRRLNAAQALSSNIRPTRSFGPPAHAPTGPRTQEDQGVSSNIGQAALTNLNRPVGFFDPQLTTQSLNPQQTSGGSTPTQPTRDLGRAAQPSQSQPRTHHQPAAGQLPVTPTSDPRVAAQMKASNQQQQARLSNVQQQAPTGPPGSIVPGARRQAMKMPSDLVHNARQASNTHSPQGHGHPQSFSDVYPNIHFTDELERLPIQPQQQHDAPQFNQGSGQSLNLRGQILGRPSSTRPQHTAAIPQLTPYQLHYPAPQRELAAQLVAAAQGRTGSTIPAASTLFGANPQTAQPRLLPGSQGHQGPTQASASPHAPFANLPTRNPPAGNFPTGNIPTPTFPIPNFPPPPPTNLNPNFNFTPTPTPALALEPANLTPFRLTQQQEADIYATFDNFDNQYDPNMTAEEQRARYDAILNFDMDNDPLIQAGLDEVEEGFQRRIAAGEFNYMGGVGGLGGQGNVGQLGQQGGMGDMGGDFGGFGAVGEQRGAGGGFGAVGEQRQRGSTAGGRGSARHHGGNGRNRGN